MPATTPTTQAPEAEDCAAPPIRLPAGPGAPGLARAYVAKWLAAWGLGHLTEDAVLVASELATNAVKASIGPEIAVEVVRNGKTVTVRVGDDNPVPPPLQPRLRIAPAELAEHGYGLLVVARTAKAFGWDPEECDGGKAVWAKIG